MSGRRTWAVRTNPRAELAYAGELRSGSGRRERTVNKSGENRPRPRAAARVHKLSTSAQTQPLKPAIYNTTQYMSCIVAIGGCSLVQDIRHPLRLALRFHACSRRGLKPPASIA